MSASESASPRGCTLGSYVLWGQSAKRPFHQGNADTAHPGNHKITGTVRNSWSHAVFGCRTETQVVLPLGGCTFVQFGFVKFFLKIRNEVQVWEASEQCG